MEQDRDINEERVFLAEARRVLEDLYLVEDKALENPIYVMGIIAELHHRGFEVEEYVWFRLSRKEVEP